MNSTIAKFGYPATLLCELDHWLVLLRPAQPTLGSLVLAAKSDANAFGGLPGEAHSELALASARIESALAHFTRFERINYLMLMMVDPHVHMHVVPRYDGSRQWGRHTFVDSGWPKMPDLGQGIALSDDDISQLVAELKPLFA